MFPQSLTPIFRGTLTKFVCRRALSASSVTFNADKGNLLGSLTKDFDISKHNDPSSISSKFEMAAGSQAKPEENKATAIEEVTVEGDHELQKYIESAQEPPALAVESLLSPLKRRIYEANCKANGGFYKMSTVVQLPDSKVKYVLKLTRDEIAVLEPSVYLKSFRLKSSFKKATDLLRLVGGMDLKKAITQCHFSDKKIARDVAVLLDQGVEDARKLGLDPDDLYIAQAWTGSDGKWSKGVDIKGRGRTGIIARPYVHVRFVLRTKSITLRRLQYEKRLKQKQKAPWIQLRDKPIRGVMGGAYKW
ncbi:HBR510Wp [Eremothecium sinecaudum]|uniref:HBR510Wp n=1 Tax=Eremothecium sinecaudum TaxID=45286 RepID=A0A120K1J4_9SACH|nr:HBR510Wp [Eremothecium sinecaudum]AMD19411.1 HBR510Wp [Eremothecium sinecaudum]